MGILVSILNKISSIYLISNGVPCIDEVKENVIIYSSYCRIAVIVYTTTGYEVRVGFIPPPKMKIELSIWSGLNYENLETACTYDIPAINTTSIKACGEEVEIPKNIYQPRTYFYYSIVRIFKNGRFKIRVRILDEYGNVVKELKPIYVKLVHYSEVAPSLNPFTLLNNYQALFKYDFNYDKWVRLFDRKCIEISIPPTPPQDISCTELKDYVKVIDIKIPSEVKLNSKILIPITIRNDLDVDVNILIKPYIACNNVWNYIGTSTIDTISAKSTKKINVIIGISHEKVRLKFKIYAKPAYKQDYCLLLETKEYTINVTDISTPSPNKVKISLREYDTKIPVGNLELALYKIGKEIKSENDVIIIPVDHTGVVEVELPEDGMYIIEAIKKTHDKVYLHISQHELIRGNGYIIEFAVLDRKKVKAIPLTYEVEIRGITTSIIAQLTNIPVIGVLTKDLLEKFFTIFIASRIVNEIKERMQEYDIIDYAITLVNVDEKTGSIRFRITILADPPPLKLIIIILLIVIGMICTTVIIKAYIEKEIQERKKEQMEMITNELNRLRELCEQGYDWACKAYQELLQAFTEVIKQPPTPTVPEWLKYMEYLLRILPYILLAMVVIEVVRIIRR